MTAITLPLSAPFPVTITSILMHNGEHISKHRTVLKYKFWDYEEIQDQDDPENRHSPSLNKKVERIGTFECPVVGSITKIYVKIGQEIDHAGIELFKIQEPCTHSVQYGGLCALCGESLDEVDYSGYNLEDRAPIAMSHGTAGLKVSLDEAEKIEQGSTERLLKDKKLILVVDLDQTVIHATVDPTVGEWKRDPSNPNYHAVEDVQAFSLEEEAVLPPGYAGLRPPPHVCWYYVKLRPGLQRFLKNISEIYELHIYTMATRSYAINVAKIIDPEGEYFGDRILSRDESGSLTQKSLKRLFPVDQSMVVIIDDRGDVWDWSSNLIKVVPYDFFVGIGDINSSFLPRQNALLGPSKRRKSVEILEESNANTDPKEFEDITIEENLENLITSDITKEDNENDSKSNEINNNTEIGTKTETTTDNTNGEAGDASPQSSSSPVDKILILGGGEDNTTLLAAQASERNASIEAQQNDRPLAKLQKDLEKIIESKNPGDEKEGKNLLYDDDTELESLEVSLKNVHKEFYKLKLENPSMTPDIEDIMPQMKENVLQGVTILFSGVLALGTRLESADIVIWAKSFGAQVVPEVLNTITHVICRNPGTFKVRVAKTLLPQVKIVNPDWLFQCIKYWARVDEEPYLVDTSNELPVSSNEIEKYQKNLFNLNITKNLYETSKRPSIDEDLDWGEVNQEVEDFLNSSGDDDDDDDDDDNDLANSTFDTRESQGSNGDETSYDKKRLRDTETGDDESKRTKTEVTGEEEIDLDELEKELMLGFEDLEQDDE